MKWIIRFFGLPGSWKWACRQMDRGHIVRRRTDTGSCKYRLDHEAQRRIVYTYSHQPKSPSDWVNAYIFLDDFECVDWEIVQENPGREPNDSIEKVTNASQPEEV